MYSPSTDGLTGGETTADRSTVMGKKYDQGEEFGQALIQHSALWKIDGFSNNLRRFLPSFGACWPLGLGMNPEPLLGQQRVRLSRCWWPLEPVWDGSHDQLFNFSIRAVLTTPPAQELKSHQGEDSLAWTNPPAWVGDGREGIPEFLGDESKKTHLS